MNNHIDDTRYMQWQDGMYVMLADLECDYELALIEDSLRGSVYFEDKHVFKWGNTEDCFGVYANSAGCWWSEALYLKLTRAQALYIATGDTDI